MGNDRLDSPYIVKGLHIVWIRGGDRGGDQGGSVSGMVLPSGKSLSGRVVNVGR